MTTILLSLLALNWLFYSVVSTFVLWTYYLVKDGDDSTPGGYVVGFLALAWTLYYFDGLRAIVLSWPGGAYVAGGYLVVGLIVMDVKWLLTLADFKRRAAEWIAEHPELKRLGGTAARVSESLYHTSYGRVNETNGSLSLDYRGFPLATWCVFWPLFTLSIVLDQVERAVRWLVNLCGALLDRAAKAFAVKV